ncbi:MAG: hypothetical protein P0Y52_01915 [Candidatus Brevundimonas phytovorans]|nr:hypothetical protein [Brevundimonas sp.]WEK58319.1 MAG: hypothetical protein P0Y52_01915 [Brevundimonas sp.]
MQLTPKIANRPFADIKSDVYQLHIEVGSGCLGGVILRKVSEGDVIAIPTASMVGVAKILFVSKYFKDMILIRLLSTRFLSVEAARSADLKGFQELIYTAVDPIRKGRWVVVAHQSVSDEERAMSKRTSGGEVWLQDTHLGPASDTDLATLPRMLVFGSGLIEKRVSQG